MQRYSYAAQNQFKMQQVAIAFEAQPETIAPQGGPAFLAAIGHHVSEPLSPTLVIDLGYGSMQMIAPQRVMTFPMHVPMTPNVPNVDELKYDYMASPVWGCTAACIPQIPCWCSGISAAHGRRFDHEPEPVPGNCSRSKAEHHAKVSSDGGNSDALTNALRHQTLMPSRILSGQDLRTTLMIRNIPVRLTSETLKEVMKLVIEINDYDMLKLPQDKHRKGCNLGYAFINLTSSDGVLRFWQAMHGRQWATLCPKSSKCCSIAYAAIQKDCAAKG